MVVGVGVGASVGRAVGVGTGVGVATGPQAESTSPEKRNKVITYIEMRFILLFS
jgi:hypothetical protein